MTKGDIVLITFPFTDLTGSKLRPALIIAVSDVDVTVLFITTQLKWMDANDVVIAPDLQNGIKKQSLLRISKIATLDKTLVKGKLGFIDKVTLSETDKKLRAYLQL